MCVIFQTCLYLYYCILDISWTIYPFLEDIFFLRATSKLRSKLLAVILQRKCISQAANLSKIIRLKLLKSFSATEGATIHFQNIFHWDRRAQEEMDMLINNGEWYIEMDVTGAGNLRAIRTVVCICCVEKASESAHCHHTQEVTLCESCKSAWQHCKASFPFFVYFSIHITVEAAMQGISVIEGQINLTPKAVKLSKCTSAPL